MTPIQRSAAAIAAAFPSPRTGRGMIALGIGRAAGAIGAWRPSLRHLWLLPGLALAVVANVSAAPHALGLAVVLTAGLTPHLPTLLGPRGRRLFNSLHEPAVPVAVLGLALVGIEPVLAAAAGLAWLGHIVLDWGFGDGLRDADGGRRRSSMVRLLTGSVASHG